MFPVSVFAFWKGRGREECLTGMQLTNKNSLIMNIYVCLCKHFIFFPRFAFFFLSIKFVHDLYLIINIKR